MLVLMLKGGVVIWVILMCSIISIALIIERAFTFVYIDRKIIQRLPLIGKQALPEPADYKNEKMDPVFISIEDSLRDYEKSQISYKELETRMSHAGSHIIRGLEKNLFWLNIIASVAPLLGLLGTVLGMINSFRAIESMISSVNPSMIAGGIWEAMITTAAGLIVAFPSIVAYHYFQSKADDYSHAVRESLQYVLHRSTS